MRKTLIIAQREMAVQIQNKTFWVFTLVLPILALTALGVSHWLPTNHTMPIISLSEIQDFKGGILAYFCMMFIVIYGVRIMRSVLEEKNNRVVEVMLGMVSPGQMVKGKILGMTGVSLLQFGLFGLIGLLGGTMLYALGFASNDWVLLSKDLWSLILLNPEQILIFIVYFILGYWLYSAFFSAMGALVDAESDTQQFSFLSLIPLGTAMISVLAFYQIPNEMNHWLQFLSVFPPTSSVAMMARWSESLPWYELAASISLLIISIYFMLGWAIRLYAKHILMFGQKSIWRP